MMCKKLRKLVPSLVLLFCFPSLLVCFRASRRSPYILSSSSSSSSGSRERQPSKLHATVVIEDPETDAQEFFYVTPQGLNIQVLSTNKEGEPVRSRANEITIADFMQQNADTKNRFVCCLIDYLITFSFIPDLFISIHINSYHISFHSVAVRIWNRRDRKMIRRLSNASRALKRN